MFLSIIIFSHFHFSLSSFLFFISKHPKIFYTFTRNLCAMLRYTMWMKIFYSTVNWALNLLRSRKSSRKISGKVRENFQELMTNWTFQNFKTVIWVFIMWIFFMSTTKSHLQIKKRKFYFKLLIFISFFCCATFNETFLHLKIFQLLN